MNAIHPTYTRSDKYMLVAGLLRHERGTLLDVGARDRVLAGHLQSPHIQYLSSDLDGRHDYHFDLERPMPLPDQAFDFVAALDVLEHVEHTHYALRELLRVTRRTLFISLPNMNSIKYRGRYLMSGRLNGKYWLLPQHQQDRHRWLPIYNEIYAYLAANAQRQGFEIAEARNILEHGGPLRLVSALSRTAAALNLFANGLFTNTVVVALRRRSSAA